MINSIIRIIKNIALVWVTKEQTPSVFNKRALRERLIFTNTTKSVLCFFLRKNWKLQNCPTIVHTEVSHMVKVAQSPVLPDFQKVVKRHKTTT